MNIETGELLQKFEDTIGLVKHTTHVQGLEDLRLYNNGTRFIATSVREYIPGVVCMVDGEYSKLTGTYVNALPIESPKGEACEKNWLPLADTGDLIYNWYPLTIGTINSNKLTIIKEYTTPPLFKLFRGSAVIKHGANWLALVHFVQHDSIRKYYHCLVELDSTYKPMKCSLPFVFKSPSVEYCISFMKSNTGLDFFTSFMDASPMRVSIPWSEMEWLTV
jgi:hypothetical protein